MRVLLVTDSYPPLIGGATRAAHLLAQELTSRGHQVRVATISQEGAPGRERLDGIEVHRLHGLTLRMPWFSADPYRRNPPPFPDPETALRLRRLIVAYSPDLVHSYGWMTYSCALALTGTTIPMVLSARDYGNVCAKRTLVFEGAVCSGPAAAKCLRCSSEFYGAPKGVVATAGVLLGRGLIRRRTSARHSVSNYVKTVMRSHLDSKKPTAAGAGLPEAVIPDFRESVAPGREAAETLGLLPDRPFILFVGALRRIKGIDQLLDAYARLDRDVPLVLIGTRAPDTPGRFPLGVTVLEQLPYAAVLAAWDRAMFGVFPSVLAEPLGNVLHEAMSRGRPVIGTRPGGHADIVDDGENGLLVPAGDSGALTVAMRRLVDDAPLRAKMGERARERAELFTPQRVVPAFENLYQRALARTA